MGRRARRAFGPRGTPSVAIIGAGFGGIAAAVKLKQAGIETFTVFEQSAGPGGTWWDNRYPGAEVDTESHLYSFSFMDYDWTRTHARQAELQQYMEDVLDRFDIREHFRFGTAVEALAWDEATHLYTVRTADGERHRFNVVVGALGLLNEPRYPDWPGLEEFAGPKFHTARWEHEHDLAGKRVAVVGTGSTAAQIVPSIAPAVGRLLLFQREPNWVIPKPDRDFTPEERQRFSSRLARRKERLRIFIRTEKLQRGGNHARPGTKTHTRMQNICVDHIERVFADHPELKAAVTPAYPFFGKRPIVASGYYEAMLRENVTLVPRALTRVTPTGVVDSDGVEHEIDVLVMSTGFQAANFLASLEVVGREGRTIHDVWDGEPKAFLGLCVPGFPNFYMLYGPNTNGGAIVYNHEGNVDFVVRNVKRMIRRGVTAIEVRQSVYERYNRWLQRDLAGTAWPDANNYYKSANGTVVTNWPRSSIPYRLLQRGLRRISSCDRRRPAVAPSPAASELKAQRVTAAD